MEATVPSGLRGPECAQGHPPALAPRDPPAASTSTQGPVSSAAAAQEGQQGEGCSPASLCSPSLHGARGKGWQSLGPPMPRYCTTASVAAAEGSLWTSPCPALAASTRLGPACCPAGCGPAAAGPWHGRLTRIPLEARPRVGEAGPPGPSRAGRVCWASRAPRSRAAPRRQLCTSHTLSTGCANQEPPSPVQSTP